MTDDITTTAKSMRRNQLRMALDAGAKGAHLGGAFSCTDILAALYTAYLNAQPQNPHKEDRDRFVLSKGHCAMAHYAALYEAGFLDKEELFSFEVNDGDFPTHSVINTEKGIEISSGSLGMGLSVGVGMALAGRRKGLDYRVFVLLGNGECNEGSVWEAFMAAAHLSLDKLYAIVDCNGQQLDGDSDTVMRMSNLSVALQSFGWNVLEFDGHDIEAISNAFDNLPCNEKPTALLAKTVKGKGVSFMENNRAWHHGRLSQEDYNVAIQELEEA